MQPKRSLAALMSFVLACATTLPALASQKTWTLSEMIICSDVVAIIDLAAIEESGPVRGHDGGCFATDVFSVKTEFHWHEVITRSPETSLQHEPVQTLRFVRRTYSEPYSQGLHLVFMRQTSRCEYELTAYRRVSILPIRDGLIDFPSWWMPSEHRDRNQAVQTLQEVGSAIRDALVPDQPQTFKTTTFYELQATNEPQDAKLHMFRANAQDPAGEPEYTHRSETAFPYLLIGRFDGPALDRDLLAKAKLVEPRERRFIIEGEWNGGYYYAKKVVSEPDGYVILDTIGGQVIDDQ